MHGPYGIVLQYDNTSNTSDQEIEKRAIAFHQLIKSLPGFRSAMYYNINEQHYCAAFSFETEPATDSALEIVRPVLAAKIPNMTLVKTEVVPGDIIPSA
jgi:hypothetical protein